MPDDQICPDCGGPLNDCDYTRMLREEDVAYVNRPEAIAEALIDNAGWQDETAYSSGGFREDMAAAQAQKRMLSR